MFGPSSDPRATSPVAIGQISVRPAYSVRSGVARWRSGKPGGNRANRLGKTEPAGPEDTFSRSRPVTRPDPALRAPLGVTSRRRPAETVAQTILSVQVGQASCLPTGVWTFRRYRPQRQPARPRCNRRLRLSAQQATILPEVAEGARAHDSATPGSDKPTPKVSLGPTTGETESAVTRNRRPLRVNLTPPCQLLDVP